MLRSFLVPLCVLLAASPAAASDIMLARIELDRPGSVDQIRGPRTHLTGFFDMHGVRADVTLLLAGRSFGDTVVRSRMSLEPGQVFTLRLEGENHDDAAERFTLRRTGDKVVVTLVAEPPVGDALSADAAAEPAVLAGAE